MFDDAFFARPAHLINRAAKLMTRLGEEVVRPHGFSIGQLPVLGALSRNAALSQKVLAEGAKIEQPSMAQMLARMERDGLIVRTADPTDKRSSLVSLTDDARSRLPAMMADMVRGGEAAMAGLSAEDIATLRRLLQVVIANLEAMEGEG